MNPAYYTTRLEVKSGEVESNMNAVTVEEVLKFNEVTMTYEPAAGSIVDQRM